MDTARQLADPRAQEPGLRGRRQNVGFALAKGLRAREAACWQGQGHGNHFRVEGPWGTAAWPRPLLSCPQTGRQTLGRRLPSSSGAALRRGCRAILPPSWPGGGGAGGLAAHTASPASCPSGPDGKHKMNPDSVELCAPGTGNIAPFFWETGLSQSLKGR